MCQSILPISLQKGHKYCHFWRFIVQIALNEWNGWLRPSDHIIEIKRADMIISSYILPFLALVRDLYALVPVEKPFPIFYPWQNYTNQKRIDCYILHRNQAVKLHNWNDISVKVLHFWHFYSSFYELRIRKTRLRKT